MAELLLSTAKSSFERRKHDISDVDDISGLFVEWCNFVCQHIYELLQASDPERYILESTFTSVTSGDQSLPSGTGIAFDNMLPKGCGVFEVDSDGNITDRRLPVTWRGSRQRGYFIKGNGTIEFTNIDTAETFIMRYVPDREKFTAVTDYFNVNIATGGVIIIDNKNLDSLIEALDVLYSKWDEVTNDEILADQRFSRAIGRISGTIRRTAKVFGVKNYNSMYS